MLSRFRCRQGDHTAVTSQFLFVLSAPFLLVPSTLTVCFHHRSALPCRALHCIALTHPNINSRARMTLAVIGALDARKQKAMCVTRGRHMSWRVGIPQRRHSWTLSDKVFQGGRPRGSLGVDDEVWSVQVQGLPVLPSRTETATGDCKAHIISCTVNTVVYSPVQSRAPWRHCQLATSPPCDTTPCP